MAEYKDITELKKQIADFKKDVHSPNGDYLPGYVCALSATEGIIAGLPDADVVEVVRCKDCEWRIYDKSCEEHYCNHVRGMVGAVGENYFCSYGERKEA